MHDLHILAGQYASSLKYHIPDNHEYLWHTDQGHNSWVSIYDMSLLRITSHQGHNSYNV